LFYILKKLNNGDP